MNPLDPILQRDGTARAMTLDEVAEDLGLSKERVRQIEQNALLKVKRMFRQLGFRPEDIRDD